MCGNGFTSQASTDLDQQPIAQPHYAAVFFCDGLIACADYPPLRPTAFDTATRKAPTNGRLLRRFGFMRRVQPLLADRGFPLA